ncbi:hypothetical protein QOZ83_16725 [Romboutsia sedimentorum]|uniref:hypothetical protein n=1 Tax=Romboutsia sedimentorum TaxID=1368474 RepID=UPI0024DED6C5|nr:hypothetical protein [Romboutsia sedimentorum]MDK2587486.1 hypothetical protein [Romboutsia sedimentorum]
MGLGGSLTLILIVLKLLKLISISWMLVCLPSVIEVLLVFIISFALEVYKHK